MPAHLGDLTRLIPRTRVAHAMCMMALVACSDSSPDRGGTLSFTYAGSASGSFSAAGPMPTIDNLLTQSSAFAALSGTGSTAHIVLVAVHASPDSSYQQLTIDVARNTAGSAGFSGATCAGCATFLFIPNGTLRGDAAPFAHCVLTSGTAVFDAVGGRVTGTFSGGGSCTTEGVSSPFSVTTGTFDVQLETSRPGA